MSVTVTVCVCVKILSELWMFLQLDALEYLHDQGYVHADIKASNLLTGYKNKHEVIYVLKSQE